MTTLEEEFLREFLDLDVVGLSSDPKIRREQDTLIGRIAKTLQHSAPLMHLLDQTRNRLQFYHGHGLRTGVMFMDLMSREQQDQRVFTYEELCAAGCYHDVGKLKVPADVLFRKEELTLEEREVIAMHTTHGAEICARINGQFSNAHHLVRNHHLYPILVAGNQFHYSTDQLTRATMLLSLADSFEALSSGRDYRGPFKVKEVGAELKKTHPHLIPETTYLFSRYTNANN